MSNQPCLSNETLAEAAQAPAGSALRQHFDGCARCQAEWLTLRAFVAPPVLPAEARAEQADAELDRFIDELTAAPVQASAPRTIVPPPSPPWWARWFAPGPRLAMAGVLVAVVVGGVWLAQHPTPERATMRGGVIGNSDAPEVTTSEPTTISDGWVLEWQPVAEATRYEVVVMGADLVERGRFDVGAATHYTLSSASLPAGSDTHEALAWLVEARRGEDVVAKSSVSELPRR